MLFVALLALVAAQPFPSRLEDAARADAAALCARFTGHDQDGDGSSELAALRPLVAAGDGPLVLVLVEERVLAPLAGAEAFALADRVERLVADLAAEGWRGQALGVRLGDAERHQDGLHVLALRELLRAFAAEDDLAGALLVGHFPDAFVVRTVNWRKRGDVTLRRGAEDEATYPGAHWLRRVPEDVAHRADVVLADLDGRWEDVYVQPRTRLEAVTAVFDGPIPAAGGPCVDLERGGRDFEDFFLVSDGKLEVRAELGADGSVVGHALLLDDRAAGHECAPADLERPNPLARPDVLVGRIDARGTALRPRADVVGVDGEGLLDGEGRPQAVRFADAAAVPHWSRGLWEPDPVLERRLLAEFLDREHAYRTGAATVVHRPASIACDLGSGYRVVARAADDWVAADAGGADARLADLAGRPTLVELVDWLGYPAELRTLRAHSDPWGSVFARPDLEALDARLGGPAWSWSPDGDRLVPSLRSACAGGKLDWFLLRSLWEHDALAPEPAFYHHTGCHGISPPGAADRPYDHPTYGLRQGAEALLLYGRGLALVGRAKVFYDEPRGFAEALASGETFGAAWARYFDLESEAPTWSAAGGDIGRKRAYFWSVLGDWTLRLGQGRAESAPRGSGLRSRYAPEDS